MSDESNLDQKYFIDRYVYNCPFCNRGNVAYTVDDHSAFDWTKEKSCHCYIICCSSCSKLSMHLSYSDIPLLGIGRTPYRKWRFNVNDTVDIDSLLFYSVPTSFFALDINIPLILRKLFTEAEGCLKSNFLTGASVCVRK
jgi:hypothetical protein